MFGVGYERGAAATSSVQLSAGRLAFTEQGYGPAIILIHGLPTFSVLWRNVLPLLAQSFHVYALDLLGYGDSDKPAAADLSLTAQAECVHEFMVRMGIPRAVLVGHNFGGGVAQICAVRYPRRVAELVLVSAAVSGEWPPPEISRLKELRWDGTLEALDLFDVFRRILRRGMARRESATDALAALYFRPFAGPAGRQAYLRAARAADSRDFAGIADDIRRIASPTMVVWGEQDRYQSPACGRRLAEELPDARLVVIPGAGHFLPEEAPDQLADLIWEMAMIPTIGVVPQPAD